MDSNGQLTERSAHDSISEMSLRCLEVPAEMQPRMSLMGLLQLRYEHDSTTIRVRYNILRGVMRFRAIMNMSILARCCRML